MQIKEAEHAGFCYGVKRAIEIVEKELQNKGKEKVYILGSLIHNNQVNEQLEKMGLKKIESLEEIENGVLIIPSHGVAPKTIETAQQKGLKVIEATCPHVSKVQKLAAQLSEEKYQIVIIGEASHSEVQGIWGYTKEQGLVVEKVEDLEKMNLSNKLGIVVQTTQTKENVRKIVGELAARAKEIKLYNTICQATAKRQKAAMELAQEVELMLVVGGKNSANTKRLAEVCHLSGLAKVYHLEKPEEIEKSWFDNVKKIGITAGASTPDWLIKRVIEKITFLGEK